jgi:Ca2+-transporting ATPase
MLSFISGASITVTVLLLGVMFYTLDGAPAVTPYAMTMVFSGLVVFELIKLYVVRWTKGTPVASNPWLTAAVAVSLGLQLVILYTPLNTYFGTVALGITDWAILGGVLLVGTPILMLVGWLVRRYVATDHTPPLSSQFNKAPERDVD